jgi:hypothetical protein
VSKKIINEVNAYAGTSQCETGFWASLEIGREKGGETIGLPIIVETFDEIDDCRVFEVFWAVLLLQRVSVVTVILERRKTYVGIKRSLQKKGLINQLLDIFSNDLVSLI